MWCKDGVYNSFVRIPDPPLLMVVDHPRLRAGRDGKIYVAATSSFTAGTGSYFTPTVSAWDGTQWTGFAAATPDPGVATGFDVFLPVDLRTADGFSFDVGNDGGATPDVVRIAYTTASATKHNLRVSECPLPLPAAGSAHWCAARPGWATDTALAGSQFLPVLRAAPEVLSDAGSVYQSAQWELAFNATDPSSPNSVSVRAGYLTWLSGTPAFANVEVVPTHPVCPEGSHYWGDYNGMGVIGPDPATPASLSPLFLAAGTNSGPAGAICGTAWQAIANPMHVSAVVF
jgi:hypothetical protein